jgi:hypothetical protein
MLKPVISTILAFSLLMSVSCNSITTTAGNSNNPSAFQKEEVKVIQFRLTQDILGLESPITINEISSVEINGEVIKGSDIKTDNFSTKAVPSLNITSANSADLNISFSDKQALKDIVVKFNLVNAKDPLVLKLIGDLYNPGKIKITYKDGKYYGGIDKGDGTIDETKITFNQDGNKLVITDPSTNKQITFDTQELEKTTNVKPKDEKTLTREDILKISKDVASQSGGLVSGILPFVGAWTFSGFGKNFELSLLNLSRGIFSLNVNIEGTDYTGSGVYDPVLKDIRELNFKTTVPRNDKLVKIEAKIELKGTNNLTFTLISADDTDLQNFKNVPFLLSRKQYVQVSEQVSDKNAKYIKTLYLDILNREADPASLNFFLNQLSSSQMNRQQLATAILTSQEGLSRKVADFFKEILGRTNNPTQLEIQPFSSLITSNSGSSLNARAAMLGSQEFFTTFGKNNNTDLVKAWYKILLDREADPAGLSLFSGALNSTPKTTVALQFLNSTEFRQSFVKKLYKKYLNREVDQTGLSFFVNFLSSGAADLQLEASLLGSNEYFAKATE